MKILIQNRRTELFFKSLGQWTKDANKAQSFGGALAAIGFSAIHNLGNTEVVFVRIMSTATKRIVAHHHQIFGRFPVAQA